MESRQTMEQNTTTNSASSPPISETEKMVQQALADAQESLSQIKEDVAAQPMAIPELDTTSHSEPLTQNIELLGDVELHVTVELGRTQMLVEDVLRLSEGSIVELDKLAGDPVDVYVNHRLIARGEVLVLNDNFCIRISEIVSDLEDQVQEAANETAASTASSAG